MAHDVSLALHYRANDVARALLGEPNRKASQLKRGILRFGNHGSLKVNCRTGLWFDFETWKGGDLLALIQREKGCDFSDDLKRGRELLGLPPEDDEGTWRPKIEIKSVAEDDAPRNRHASISIPSPLRSSHDDVCCRALAIRRPSAPPLRPGDARSQQERRGRSHRTFVPAKPVLQFARTNDSRRNRTEQAHASRKTNLWEGR